MTDAIITDINEFRNRKANPVLSGWSDRKLQTRFAVLQHVENGADYLVDQSNPMVRTMFPNGFNPDTDPTHNIHQIQAEADRRGVKLT